MKRLTLPLSRADVDALELGEAVTVSGTVTMSIGLPTHQRMADLVEAGAPLPVDLRNLLLSLVLFSVWLWVCHWTVDLWGRGSLTAAWTLFALVTFGVGLALRERIYRLAGFITLGLAVGRLFFLDVWRFDSLYRIISFLVLGAGLLVLSFVYHRFADSLRKYL